MRGGGNLLRLHVGQRECPVDLTTWPPPQVRGGRLRRELSVGRLREEGHGRCMRGRVVYREEKEAAGAADQSRDWRACVLLSARARYL